MKACLSSRRRGLTLVETAVSMLVSGFIFVFAGYLIFMVTKNAYNLTEQVRSQTSASSASERVASLVRKASHFSPYSSDVNGTTATFSRIKFVVPAVDSTVTTRVVCYNPEKRRVEYYKNENDVSFNGTQKILLNGEEFICPIPKGTPTLQWPGQTAFFVTWESRYRVTLQFEYQYSGFALGELKGRQRGRYITDVIAKNHYLDKAAQDSVLGGGGEEGYAHTDTGNPALLY